jgi:hypothetical protein
MNRDHNICQLSMDETASQQENNNKDNKMCIPKSVTHHKQKGMKVNLPSSAPEWIMPQPTGH